MWGIADLFQWVIMSSMMASVVITLILLAKLIFKNRLGANWHYYIWFLLIIRLLIPYAPKSSISIFNVVSKVTLSDSNYYSYYPIHENIYYNEAEKDKEMLEGTNKTLFKDNGDKKIYSDTNSYVNTHYEKMKFKLVFLWTAGVLILGIYIIIKNIKLLLAIKMQLEFHDESVNHIFNECKNIMRINKDIPIVVTSIAITPSLFGVISPKLLLPNNLLEKISKEELKYIFLHELAHFKRKDILVNWVVILLQILHWFNPVVWLGFYKMHNDCEMACDARVLSCIREEERKEYGYTIIHLLNIISQPKLIPGSTGILSSKYHIKRRITMISLFKKGSFWGKVIAIIFFIVIGFLGLTNSKQPKDVKSLQNTNISENKENKNDLSKIAEKVEGKGVIVTLSDKDNIEKVTTKEVPYQSIVFLPDIVGVMNELSNAGSKSISLNDERVIDINKVQVSGPFIVVNDKKIGNPFVIKAIGDPIALENSLKSEKSILHTLRKREIGVKLDKTEKIIMPEIKN